ncbi:MAG: hypothetical protein PSU94_15800 [Lacunisphaera sp.]|nr:hypothetical protein [Lacunisphaera sp.]
MSDRLKDLQRQRALAQEQLAWIDAEIAKASGQAPAPSQPAISSAPVAPPPRGTAETARLADEILAQYQSETVTSPKDVKRGCYVYFVLAFVLVGLAVAALYFYSGSKH